MKKKCFGSNRNKPKQDLFRVCFGLFRETKNKKFRFVSVFRTYIETTVYDQAVIEKISLRTEIKRIDITLSQCVIGIKRIPGVQYHSHVLAVERLRVIEEGHTDVNWEPEPTKTSRQELIERLRTLSKSQKQNQSPSDDDNDWEIPTTNMIESQICRVS